jgi:hypothetical protein
MKKMEELYPANAIIYSECVDLTLDEIFTLEVKNVKGEKGDVA